MTTIAPNRSDLPPPFVPDTPTHTLYDGDHVVGWTDDHHLGFTGFASAPEAAAAAWVAHRAVARRMAMDRGDRPIPVDIEPLSLARGAAHDLILAAGRPIARLVQPGDVPPAPDASFGFELELDPALSEVRIHTLSHLAYRALRRSGIRWALWDRARRRVTPIVTEADAAPERPSRAQPRDAGDTNDVRHVVPRALLAGAAVVLAAIVVLGLGIVSVGADALLLLGGTATMAAAMIFVSRRRARRLPARGTVAPALRGIA